MSEIRHTPEELADMEQCAEVLRRRQQLTGSPLLGLEPATVTWWDDYILPGETRLHAMWRRFREIDPARVRPPVESTYAAYFRRGFDDERGKRPGYTWQQYLEEMYGAAVEWGFTGTWDDFLREAGAG